MRRSNRSSGRPGRRGNPLSEAGEPSAAETENPCPRHQQNRLGQEAAEAAQRQGRAGLVGYANTGKSSVINSLGGGARTSSKAGFTRGKQWLRVTKRILLLDSPGIIPRKEGEAALAIKGAYDITKLKDPIGAAMKLIRKVGSKKIAKAYTVEPFDDAYEQLEELAGKWMMLRKGAELDLDRAARRLIKEWQTGKLK